MPVFRKASLLSNRDHESPLKTPEPAMAPSFVRERDVRTCLGSDAKVTGKLSFTTPSQIDGTLKGEVRCTDLLIIGESATIDGIVRAKDLRVDGTIVGEVRESGRVEVRAGGVVRGSIEAERLVVHEDGLFDGKCSMGLGDDSSARVAR